jgi:hypothetical protein
MQYDETNSLTAKDIIMKTKYIAIALALYFSNLTACFASLEANGDEAASRPTVQATAKQDEASTSKAILAHFSTDVVYAGLVAADQQFGLEVTTLTEALQYPRLATLTLANVYAVNNAAQTRSWSNSVLAVMLLIHTMADVTDLSSTALIRFCQTLISYNGASPLLNTVVHNLTDIDRLSGIYALVSAVYILYRIFSAHDSYTSTAPASRKSPRGRK